MAPFDNPPSSSLTSKISPLIDGQLPDYIRDDHQLFSKFIQYYYQYLEAAELIVTAQVDNVIQETFDVQYILDENDDQIVYEESVGKFSAGETITGSTSGATGVGTAEELSTGLLDSWYTTIAASGTPGIKMLVFTSFNDPSSSKELTLLTAYSIGSLSRLNKT